MARRRKLEAEKLLEGPKPRRRRRTQSLTAATVAPPKPAPETQHSPSGMKQVGVLVTLAGFEKPLHFPLGCQWRWFAGFGVPKPLLQVVHGEAVVAEIDAAIVMVVCGPTWTSPMQRTPERP